MASRPGYVKVGEYAPMLAELEKKGISAYAFRINYVTGANHFNWLAPEALPLALNWTRDKLLTIHEIIASQYRSMFIDCEHDGVDGEAYADEMAQLPDIVRSLFGAQLRVIITTASTKKKMSYHVVVPNLVFGNNDALKQAVELLQSRLSEMGLVIGIYFDMPIYRNKTQLRIYRSFKESVRPFVLHRSSDKPLALTDMFVTSPDVIGLEGCIVIGETKAYTRHIRPSGPITLKGDTDKILSTMGSYRTTGDRLTFTGGWDCPICDRHHDNDNARIREFESGFWLHCFRAGKGVFVKTDRAPKRTTTAVRKTAKRVRAAPAAEMEDE